MRNWSNCVKPRKSYSMLFLVALIVFLLFNSFFAGVIVRAEETTEEKTDEKKIESVDDLQGKKIGVQLGTTGDIYASDYEGDEEGTEIIRYNKGADAIQALKQKKIDCVLIDEKPAKSFVDKNVDLMIIEEEFAVEDYAICISKDNQQLTKKFNTALNELKEEGIIEQIISNYIGDETKGKNPYVTPAGTNHPNGELIMATNVAFPPYEYYENGKATGIDVDIATAIGDKLGYKIKVSDMEFDSIIVAVSQGKADFGAAGMTVTEERLRNIDFTNSYTTAKQVIVVLSGDSAEKKGFVNTFKHTFIDENRWEYIVKGLKNTLIISLCACAFGIIVGLFIAIIRIAYAKADKRGFFLCVANIFVKLYLTIFRGTPMVVQLLIMYYVIFAQSTIDPVIVATIAFGLNSGAYVSEAIRSGINAIPNGQFEAGRSIGFSYTQTMKYIIMPQAIKNALPAMCNEFIALIKETSVVGYIGIMDVTRGGDIIRGTTFEAMMPYFAVAIIYLIIVIILTCLVSRLERRLTKNER